MSIRIAKPGYFIIMILVIFFLLSSAGCGLLPGNKSGKDDSDGSLSAEAIDKFQPGGWEGEFTVDLKSGKTEYWIVYFVVNDDGKSVSSVELIHSIGPLSSDNDGTALLTLIDSPIENNSFEFTLSELGSNYQQYKYVGSVKFTSSEEAKGTLNVYDKDHKFTAFPLPE